MKNKFSMALLAAGLLIPLSLNAFAQPNGRPQQGNNQRGERDFRGGPSFRSAKMQLGRTWRGIGALEKSKTPLSKAQAKKVVALVLPVSKKSTLSETDAEKLDDKLQAVLTSAQKSALDDRPFGGPRGEGGPRRERGEGGPRGEDGPRGEGRRGGFDGPPRDGGPGRGGDRDGGPGRGGPDGDRREGGLRGERGPRGEGGGRFGGMNDNNREQMRTWMESYNLFYAPTGNPNWKRLPSELQQNIAKRYKNNRAMLEALSRKSKG